jgi:hypothetical protein
MFEDAFTIAEGPNTRPHQRRTAVFGLYGVAEEHERCGGCERQPLPGIGSHGASFRTGRGAVPVWNTGTVRVGITGIGVGCEETTLVIGVLTAYIALVMRPCGCLRWSLGIRSMGGPLACAERKPCARPARIHGIRCYLFFFRNHSWVRSRGERGDSNVSQSCLATLAVAPVRNCRALILSPQVCESLMRVSDQCSGQSFRGLRLVQECDRLAPSKLAGSSLLATQHGR